VSRLVCGDCFCTFDEETDECGCMPIENVYLAQFRVYHGFPYSYFWVDSQRRIVGPNFDTREEAVEWSEKNLDERQYRINL
jgi:hypothetical protein